MNEEEKKKMEDLEKQVADGTTALDAEKAGRVEDKEAHEKTVAEKDVLIKQKTDDVIGARKESQKLKKLSEEDKEAMSEKEIEHHNELIRQQEEMDGLRKDKDDRDKKELDARKDSAIKKIAGDNKELAEKITKNFERIKDSNKAVTEEEINNLVNDAHNMLGEPKPDAVNDAFGGMGGDAPGAEDADGGFADTAKGKSAAKEMGLGQAQEEQK